jgi:hypothetical protein
LEERAKTTHVAHDLGIRRDKADQRRFIEAVEGLRSVRSLCPLHLLGVQEITFDRHCRAWIITPYMGTNDGLLTITDLLSAKGGHMAAAEVERVMAQLLEAVQAAHDAGVWHGPIAPAEVQVDRHGAVWVELYGLALRLGAARPGPEPARDEVRSIVAMGYWLLTGLGADEPRLGVERLLGRQGRWWDHWFDAGLDPVAGFGSAREALEALRARREAASSGPVRVVLGRLFRGRREEAATARR